jgi:hypothetical protein
MSSVSTTLLVVIIVRADDLLHPLGGVRRLQGHPMLSNVNMVLAGLPRPGRLRRRPDRS